MHSRFVLELCEPMQAVNVEMASFELFSSQPKSFKVFLSDRWVDWPQSLGILAPVLGYTGPSPWVYWPRSLGILAPVLGYTGPSPWVYWPQSLGILAPVLGYTGPGPWVYWPQSLGILAPVLGYTGPGPWVYWPQSFCFNCIYKRGNSRWNNFYTK